MKINSICQIFRENKLYLPNSSLEYLWNLLQIATKDLFSSPLDANRPPSKLQQKKTFSGKKYCLTIFQFFKGIAFQQNRTIYFSLPLVVNWWPPRLLLKFFFFHPCCKSVTWRKVCFWAGLACFQIISHLSIFQQICWSFQFY